jgi:hypothetical protein
MPFSMRVAIFVIVFGTFGAAQATPTTATVGGCATLVARNPQLGGPALQEYCSHFADPPSLEWALDSMSAALDLAEEAICGHAKCATGDRYLRFIIVNTTDTNAYSSRSPDLKHIDIAFTLGMVQFVDAVSRGTLENIGQMANGEDWKKNHAGLLKWFDQMFDRGGETCSQGLEMPSIPNLQKINIDQQKAIALMRAMNIAAYEFIILHELAHTLKGSSCGSKGDISDIEQACDDVALGWFLPQGSAPTMIVGTFAAIGMYESLQEPLLSETHVGPPSKLLTSIFPGRDWSDRAIHISSEWVNFCRKDSKSKSCADFKDQNSLMIEFSTAPAPDACKLKSQ